MPDLTTVSGCISAGNYTQAISVAADVMNGNQEIQDALVICQAIQAAQGAADKKALAIADGN